MSVQGVCRGWVCLEGGVFLEEGGLSRGGLLPTTRQVCLEGGLPNPLPYEQTDTSENITFPCGRQSMI